MTAIDFIHGALKQRRVTSLLADATEIVIVSGYVTEAGFKLVRSRIKQCLDRGGKVTLLFGIDRGGVAGPALIELLGGLIDRYEQLRVFFVIESGRSFLHAKIYAARKARRAQLLVGSFNLTSKGLGRNHEFGVEVSSQPGAIFEALRDFVNSLQVAQQLTPDNWKPLAKALEPASSGAGGDESEDEARKQAAEQHRREAKERLDKLMATLSAATGELLRTGESADWLAALLAAGTFYSHRFDVKKLSVSAGLSFFYEAGILPRETQAQAGTARYRQPAGSAAFPLLPPTLQARYTRCGRSLGRALSRSGFETPYGHWVPHAHVAELRRRFRAIESELPPLDAVEQAVAKQVGEHREHLDASSRELMERVLAGGLRAPQHWRDVRDPTFKQLRRKAEPLALDGDAWRRHPLYQASVDAVRDRITAVVTGLDASKALQKIRRLRVQLYPVPVQLDDEGIGLLLESMVWAVVEASTSRRRRRCIQPLLAQVKASGATTEDLEALCEALLGDERDDETLTTFFAVFGKPPYWSGASPWEPTADQDEAEQDDDDDAD